MIRIVLIVVVAAQTAALTLSPATRGPVCTISSRAAVHCSLTEGQRDTLIEASSELPFCSTGRDPLTQAKPSTWAAVRDRWPSLNDCTDEDLAEAYMAYLSAPPNLLEVLIKTPLGPFLLLWGVPWADVFDIDSLFKS